MIELDYGGAIYPAQRLKLGTGLAMSEDSNGLPTLALGTGMNIDIGGGTAQGAKISLRGGSADMGWIDWYPRAASPNSVWCYTGFYTGNEFQFYGYAGGVSAWNFWIADSHIGGFDGNGLRLGSAKGIYAYRNGASAYELRIQFPDTTYTIIQGPGESNMNKLWLGAGGDANSYLNTNSFFLRDTSSNTKLTLKGTDGAVLSSGLGGIGYATGAGGSATQATNKSTGVTIDKPSGVITMNGAALGANTTVSFTLTNSCIAATDHVLVDHGSTGSLGSYLCTATPAAGSATIYVRNVSAGSLSEAIVLKFTVIKGVSS